VVIFILPQNFKGEGMIKSILLAVDGSIYTNSVIDHGIDLAKKLDAFLRVSTIIDIRVYEWVLNTGGEGYMPVIPTNVYHDESYKFHRERADVLIESLQSHLAESGVKFDTEKLEGAPVEIICDISRQVDLVIMGARGDYARWGDRLLGDTLEAVSHDIHAPLLIVSDTFQPIKSVTCAYDRSETSNKGLKLSAYLADELKIPLEVLTIHDDEVERDDILNEAKAYIDPYGLESKYRHETGDPDKTLIRATEDTPGPALLIMGCYGHSRIREAILGSTTSQVMRKAQKPILLAK
jgi:nucleotide-binding universal stress UspA family protein